MCRVYPWEKECRVQVSYRATALDLPYACISIFHYWNSVIRFLECIILLKIIYFLQGRHIHNSLHSSPLHHGVLYRSLPEDTPSIQSQYEQKYDHDPGGGEETDDKSGLLHAALPAQPGISRYDFSFFCVYYSGWNSTK